MIMSFKEYFLKEDKAAKSLPHIIGMGHQDTKNLVKSGKIHLKDVTEKTDGYPMAIGHDENGFYVQNKHAGHEKMRTEKDYKDRALEKEKRTGNKHNPNALKTFQEIHNALANNHNLKSHLENLHDKSGKEVRIKGEMLHLGSSSPGANKDERKFISTSYSTKDHGKIGKFIVHTKLASHDVDTSKMSDKNIKFDDDKIKHAGGHVDVSKEKEAINKLDHNLLSSRTTKTNKAAKEKEQEKLKDIQKTISDKVDKHIYSQNIPNKFGSGTEGYVIHPHGDQPRFKVTSPEFRHVVNNKIKPTFDRE